MSHIHVVRQHPERGFTTLADCPDARERLTLLRDAGFDGSYTIEFTAGVSQAPEDRETLFVNAVSDLDWLKEHA